MRNKEDIMCALKRVSATMKNEDMMRSRFGLEHCEVDEERSKEECIKDNLDIIIQNSANERSRYQYYINNLFDNGTVAVVDAVSAGTLGKYFLEATDRCGCLLCMVISNVPDYSVCDEIDCMAYMGEDSKYLPKLSVHKYVGGLEGVLTSDAPMFIRFSENGEEYGGQS